MKAQSCSNPLQDYDIFDIINFSDTVLTAANNY